MQAPSPAPPPASLVQRFWRRRVLLGAAALLALIASAGALDAASRTRDVRDDLLAAEARLERVRSVMSGLLAGDEAAWPTAEETRAAIDDLAAARGHLDRAEGRLAYLRLALPMVDWLPPTDGASELPALIDLARDTAASGEELLTAFSPMTAPSEAEATLPVIQRARSVIVDHGDAIDGALARLAQSQAVVERLRERSWGSILDRVPAALDSSIVLFDRAVELRETFRVARAGFDPLFGFDEPRTYVIVGMNEAEIRATGGFMGSMGLVTIQDGEIVQSRYDRVEAFERPLSQPGHPQPPEELYRYMGAANWLLRDANWSPDFPTSARAILEFLERDQGIRADGVVGLTTLFMDRLVTVHQPLSLHEYPDELRADNWRGVVEGTLIEGGSTPEATYLHPLMEALLTRMQATPAAQMPALLDALTAGGASRDLQFYAVAEEMEALADEFGVSGRLTAPADGDFVAVVDSNVSWSKIQPAISREVLYLSSSTGASDVLVTWHNRASAIDPAQYPRLHHYGDLWDLARFSIEHVPAVFGNYVRIYLPPDATAIDMKGFVGPPRLERTDQFTVASGLVHVRDGESKSVVVSYRLPAPPARVTFWKQGGQLHDRLRVLRNDADRQVVLRDDAFTSDVVVTLVDEAAAPVSGTR